MSKVEEYKEAGFIIDNPENENEVIFNIPMRIAKSVVEGGGFELSASAQGWHPQSGILAPQACIDGVKRYAAEQMINGVKQQIAAQAQAQLDAIVGALEL